jgi:hypothetical protein
MTYDLDALGIYEKMVIERHLIWYRRQTNQPPPWTEDPILSNLKMTNMFRVLDPGSQFVFTLSTPDPIDTITRLVFYRTTNLPATWYMLRAALGDFPTANDFIREPMKISGLLQAHRAAGNRIFSGAYIIVPEPGTRNDKAEGAVRLTRRFAHQFAPAFLAATTQEERFAVLRSTPGLGPFLSMQILTDWGYLQKRKPDLSFVIAGPGARRGAAILNPDIPAEQVIQEVYTEWAVDRLVRLGGKPLTPMDVQNTMCEWSKYHREIATPRKKSVYRPAHPGAQPQPILPQWW